MSTELMSTPQSILPPRSAAGAGAGQGGARVAGLVSQVLVSQARVAGLSGRAPSGIGLRHEPATRPPATPDRPATRVRPGTLRYAFRCGCIY